MLQPDFAQIWGSGWREFQLSCRYHHYIPRSRIYYQIRSVVRTVSFISVFVVASQLLQWVDTWK